MRQLNWCMFVYISFIDATEYLHADICCAPFCFYPCTVFLHRCDALGGDIVLLLFTSTFTGIPIHVLLHVCSRLVKSLKVSTHGGRGGSVGSTEPPFLKGCLLSHPEGLTNGAAVYVVYVRTMADADVTLLPASLWSPLLA